MKEILLQIYHTALILGFVALLLGAAYWMYASILSRMRNRILEAKARCQTLRRQREELTAPLRQMVAHYMGHERALLQQIAALRSHGYGGAARRGHKRDRHFGNVIRSLTVAVEAYPQLRAVESVVSLMESLNRLQERIVEAEREHAACVRVYRDAQMIWPLSALARIAGHGMHPFLSDEVREFTPPQAKQMPPGLYQQPPRSRNRHNKRRFFPKQRRRWVSLSLLSIGLVAAQAETSALGKATGIPQGVYRPGTVLASDGAMLATFTNRASGKTERVYPMRALTGQLVGYRNPEGWGGLAGWEAIYDDLLGWNPAQGTTSIVSRSFLTVRIEVQRILHEELQSVARLHRLSRATAVAIEPSTGRILGMSDWPAVNPYTKSARGNPASWLIHSVSEFQEPGMALRPLLLATFLQEGGRPEMKIDCGNGRFVEEGVTIEEAIPFDSLSAAEVMTKPSRIGMVMMGCMLRMESLYAALTNAGFGHRTGILLPEETGGILQPPHTWTKQSYFRLPLGYGLGVTTLQMTLTTAAVGNGGVYCEPLLLDRIETETGQLIWAAKTNYRRLWGTAVARETARLMESMITLDRRKTSISGPVVAGCSGTMLIAGPNARQKQCYQSQCYGFTPAEKPSICVGVMIEYSVASNNDRISPFAVTALQKIVERCLQAQHSSAR